MGSSIKHREGATKCTAGGAPFLHSIKGGGGAPIFMTRVRGRSVLPRVK